MKKEEGTAKSEVRSPKSEDAIDLAAKFLQSLILMKEIISAASFPLRSISDIL